MKEGNSKELKGDFTLGLVSSKFTLKAQSLKTKPHLLFLEGEPI